MSVEQWLLAAVATVACVALLVVVLLAVQLRRTRTEVWDAVRNLLDERNVLQTERHSDRSAGRNERPVPVLTSLPAQRVTPPVGTDGRTVVTSDGRTFVLPTSGQVVDATMGRPMVRGAVLSHGLWHALRPESRDRISALVRREFRRRRKVRRRAGRRAARNAPMPGADAQAWLGSRTSVPSEQGGRR